LLLYRSSNSHQHDGMLDRIGNFDQLAGCRFRVGVGRVVANFMLQLGDFAGVGKSWFGPTTYINILNQELWVSITLGLEPLHDPNRDYGSGNLQLSWWLLD
jgi:hypothetical protein